MEICLLNHFIRIYYRPENTQKFPGLTVRKSERTIENQWQTNFRGNHRILLEDTTYQ